MKPSRLSILLPLTFTLASPAIADDKELSSRLDQLRDSYDRKVEQYEMELEQKIKKLNEAYRGELKNLKDSHLEAGNLEEANAVQSELKRIETIDPTEALFSAINGHWAWSTGNTFEITDKQYVISHKGKRGKVKLIDLEQSKIKFDWGGNDYELIVSADWQSMIGTEVKTGKQYTARRKQEQSGNSR